MILRSITFDVHPPRRVTVIRIWRSSSGMRVCKGAVARLTNQTSFFLEKMNTLRDAPLPRGGSCGNISRYLFSCFRIEPKKNKKTIYGAKQKTDKKCLDVAEYSCDLTQSLTQTSLHTSHVDAWYQKKKILHLLTLCNQPADTIVSYSCTPKGKYRLARHSSSMKLKQCGKVIFNAFHLGNLITLTKILQTKNALLPYFHRS